MLACPSPSEGLEFPLFASAKLDGVRCLIGGAKAMSRQMEAIPNAYVQRMLGHALLDGLDGELCVGPPYSPTLFQDTQSGVMRHAGEPDFVFHVFDFWTNPEMPFHERYKRLFDALATEPYSTHPRLQLVEQVPVKDMDQLVLMEEDYLERGYEGLILRSVDGPYKYGRSTAKQGYMMKLKKFSTGEAVVIGFKELYVNENELEESALGLAKRSSAKEGLVAGGVLGALLVRDCVSGVEFGIGSGFTAEQRATFWNHRNEIQGSIVKYKHFEIGVKDAPRFPTFLGWRDPRDMGEPQ
jgi:DNA ligase-1